LPSVRSRGMGKVAGLFWYFVWVMNCSPSCHIHTHVWGDGSGQDRTGQIVCIGSNDSKQVFAAELVISSSTKHWVDRVHGPTRTRKLHQRELQQQRLKSRPKHSDLTIGSSVGEGLRDAASQRRGRSVEKEVDRILRATGQQQPGKHYCVISPFGSTCRGVSPGLDDLPLAWWRT
jgi:hypothetical protein